MKRTIALVLSLLMLLVLVPTAALADTEVNPRLEVTPVAVAPATTPKTLFQFGVENFFWTDANLSVKLFDETSTNLAGTTLHMGIENAPGVYVLYINGAVYNPALGYGFAPTDLGPKTLTVKYTYTPTGNTKAVTVTKDISISVQKSILQSITLIGPSQLSYYAGEVLNLSGLVVSAKYSNMTDPVVLDSSKYTLRLFKDAEGTSEIGLSDKLTDQNKLKVSVTETYPGSETPVTASATASIVVTPTATSLSISPTTADMTLGITAPITITATTDAPTSLIATVDNPAVVAIDTQNLTSTGAVKVTALSVGTAIVTIRARGTDFTYTTTVNVAKQPTHVNSLVLDKANLSLPVNGTYSFTATIGPDDATDKSIKWTVEAGKEGDVSIDSTGTVKVLRNFSGTVKVTATSNDNAAAKQDCLISVNSIKVDGIALSDTNVTIFKGSWKQLTAVVTPTGAADPAITWLSSNPAVATVDSTGKVTAVGTVPAGQTYIETTITAQTSNTSVFATCTVRVQSSVLITSLTLNKSELALNVGDEETLTVTGAPSNATNKTLAWKSSNPEVASVNSSGKVIAASKGTAVIRADSTDGSGKYVSCVVTVNNIQVLNVSLDKSSLDLSEGDTASIVATVYPANVTNKTLKWTSSNSSVASVDSKGNIVAGGIKGYAIITATATDGSGKFAECVVLSKPKIHVTGLTINYGASLDLLANDSTYLKATVLPANATAQTVTWATSNAAIATVDASTGLLKGIALGEATITATCDGKSTAIKVNVTNTEFNYGVAGNFKRRVNVRASASGLSKAVGFAYVGDTFKILGKSGSWYLIQYNNTTKAYIWSAYLKATKTSAAYVSANGTTTSTPAPGASPTPVTTPTKVTIANCVYAINVRASASTTSKKVGKANLGATFTYLGKEGDWYKIQYNTTTVAYVYGTFVTLS